MHVDRPLVDLRRLCPDGVKQLLAAEHPARLLQKIFEQAEFGRPQVNDALTAPHPSCLAVEAEVAGGETVGDALGAAATQPRPAPAPSAREPRRACDIVVGADRKPAHPLGPLAARSA